MKKILTVLMAIAVTTTLSSCAAFGAIGESLNRDIDGVPATMSTYTQGGILIDQVIGESFHVSRDENFDSESSDGTSNNDSSVLMISVGKSHISHVGSTLVLAEKGLNDIMAQTGTTVNLVNSTPGKPWLNNLREKHQNLWAGKSKTVLIRSQDGTPVATFTGNKVETFETDVPKSTWFRVDGKYLFVYRADYSLYDNDLLGK